MSKLTKQSIPCILTVHLSLYLQFFSDIPAVSGANSVSAII